MSSFVLFFKEKKNPKVSELETFITKEEKLEQSNQSWSYFFGVFVVWSYFSILRVKWHGVLSRGTLFS